MTTFYTIANLEALPEILKEGISSGWELFQDKRDAEFRWEYEDQVLLSVEVEDPESMLTPDYDAIDHAAEMLMTTARPVEPGEEESGFVNSFTEEPLTWDEPVELAVAAALKQYEKGRFGWKDSLEVFGTVQLDESTSVLPDKIALLSPVDPAVLQSIESKQQFSEAVAATEPVALTSLGAGFWVWLLMMIQFLAFGKTPFEKEKAEESSAKKRARKSKRKKAKKKAAKAQTEAQAEAGEVASG